MNWPTFPPFPRIVPKGWVFEILYLCVAIATFEHTAWASGTIFLGPPGTEYFTVSDPIWLRGAFVAIAIDVGLFLVSQQIVQYVREGSIRDRLFGVISLSLTFLIIDTMSFYAQLVFMFYHTPILEVSEGISVYWQETLQGVMDGAHVIFALALPVMALAYTLSRIFISHTEVVKQEVVRRKIAAKKPVYKMRVKGVVKSYKNKAGMKSAMTRYTNNGIEFELLSGGTEK